MQITMKDRVAVVTGGSKGIGIAVARRFAESGAKVAILARGAAELKAAREQLAKDGLHVHDYVCDVSKASDISATYERIVKDHGKVDILVNAMLVGLIVSDQWVKRHAQKAPDTDFDAFTRDLAKGVPLGRMGTAEEFANLACFLASDQGSYITGTAINVDGGRSPVV